MSINRRLHCPIQKLTLLMIIFIDGLGMSLILPLLNPLFVSGNHRLLSPEASTVLAQFFYGASLISFTGAMVIGATVLGQISDIKGRKWTLCAALCGSTAGYLVCIIAVLLKSPWLFLFGRIIDGLTAGSIPVAQAFLTDLDQRDNKMTSIGLVMFAVTAGYMFGPLIASIEFYHLVNHLVTPFILVALMCLVSLCLLSTLKESFKRPDNIARRMIDLTQITRQLKQLLLIKQIRLSLFGFFLFQCGWTLFYQYLPQLSLNGYGLSSQQITLLMIEVGIAMCLGFCVIVAKVQALGSPKNLSKGGLIIFLMASSYLAFTEVNFYSLQVLSILLAILYTVTYSSLLAYMVSLANQDVVGLLFGSIASICAISATLSAFVGSLVIHHADQSIYMLLSLIVLVSILFLLIRPQSTHANDSSIA